MALSDDINEVLREYADQQERMTKSGETTLSLVNLLNKVLKDTTDDLEDLAKGGRLTAKGFEEAEKKLDKFDKVGMQQVLKAVKEQTSDLKEQHVMMKQVLKDKQLERKLQQRILKTQKEVQSMTDKYSRTLSTSISGLVASIPLVGTRLASEISKFFASSAWKNRMDKVSLSIFGKKGGKGGMGGGKLGGGGLSMLKLGAAGAVIMAITGIVKSLMAAEGVVSRMVKSTGFLRKDLKGVNRAIIDSYGDLMKFDISLSEIEGIAGALVTEFGSINMINKEMIQNAAKWSKTFQLGAEEIASFVDVMTRVLGKTNKEMNSFVESLDSKARSNFVSVNLVMRDITRDANLLALYMKGTGEGLKDAAIQARRLGVTLATSEKISSSFLDFEEASTKTMELNNIFGTQLNAEALHRLAIFGDIGDVQEKVLDAVIQENRWGKMNRLQQIKLASLLGISVEETAKLLIDKGKLIDLEGEELAIYIKTRDEASKIETQLKEQQTSWGLIWNTIKSKFMPILMDVGLYLSEVINPWALKISDAIDYWFPDKNNMEGVGDGLSSIWSAVIKKLKIGVKIIVEDVLPVAVTAIKGLWTDVLSPGIKAIWTSLISPGINKVLNAFLDRIDDSPLGRLFVGERYASGELGGTKAERKIREIRDKDREDRTTGFQITDPFQGLWRPAVDAKKVWIDQMMRMEDPFSSSTASYRGLSDFDTLITKLPALSKRSGGGGKQATADGIKKLLEQWEETEDFGTGGIVTKPTRALIGERGPEMIIPMGPHSGFDSSGVVHFGSGGRVVPIGARGASRSAAGSVGIMAGSGDPASRRLRMQAVKESADAYREEIKKHERTAFRKELENTENFTRSVRQFKVGTSLFSKVNNQFKNILGKSELTRALNKLGEKLGLGPVGSAVAEYKGAGGGMKGIQAAVGALSGEGGIFGEGGRFGGGQFGSLVRSYGSGGFSGMLANSLSEGGIISNLLNRKKSPSSSQLGINPLIPRQPSQLGINPLIPRQLGTGGPEKKAWGPGRWFGKRWDGSRRGNWGAAIQRGVSASEIPEVATGGPGSGPEPLSRQWDHQKKAWGSWKRWDSGSRRSGWGGASNPGESAKLKLPKEEVLADKTIPKMRKDTEELVKTLKAPPMAGAAKATFDINKAMSEDIDELPAIRDSLENMQQAQQVQQPGGGSFFDRLGIKNPFSGMKNPFKGIKNPFKGITDGVKDMFSGMGGKLKDMFGGMGGGKLGGMMKRLKLPGMGKMGEKLGKFGGLASGLKEGIGGFLSGDMKAGFKGMAKGVGRQALYSLPGVGQIAKMGDMLGLDVSGAIGAGLKSLGGGMKALFKGDFKGALKGIAGQPLAIGKKLFGGVGKMFGIGTGATIESSWHPAILEQLFASGANLRSKVPKEAVMNLAEQMGLLHSKDWKRSGVGLQAIRGNEEGLEKIMAGKGNLGKSYAISRANDYWSSVGGQYPGSNVAGTVPFSEASANLLVSAGVLGPGGQLGSNDGAYKLPGLGHLRSGLADGGVVTRPVLSPVGEAGPEAVIPLSKAPAILSQAMDSSGIINEIRELRAAILELSKRPIHMNGRRVSDIISEEFEEMARQ